MLSAKVDTTWWLAGIASIGYGGYSRGCGSALPDDTRYQALPDDTRYQVLPDDTRYQALPDDTRYQALPDDTRYQALNYTRYQRRQGGR